MQGGADIGFGLLTYIQSKKEVFKVAKRKGFYALRSPLVNSFADTEAQVAVAVSLDLSLLYLQPFFSLAVEGQWILSLVVPLVESTLIPLEPQAGEKPDRL